jgi:ABC-type dipeptide/oligopeptide/nickel transport system permease component
LNSKTWKSFLGIVLIVGRRLFFVLLTLWAVFTITFILMRLAPGGPFASERRMPEIILRNMEAKYHLNDPPLKQYLDSLASACRFDFGPSMKLEDYTVNQVIAAGFPISVSIGIFSLSLATMFGIVAGVISASRRGTTIDWGIMGVATIGISVPSFVLGCIALIVFVFWLNWFPAGGWGQLKQLILPGVCLALPYAAYIARLTRTGMLEQLHRDYVRTAHAKGLREYKVVFGHALRGALLPVITFLGPATAGVLTGSLVLESLFNIAGMGRSFVEAANQRDWPMCLGMVMVYALALVIMNNLVDVAYAVVDPRVKVE